MSKTPPVVDLLEGTRTILRSLQARMARDLSAGRTVSKDDQRQLVALTERVERLRPGGNPPAPMTATDVSTTVDSRYCGAKKKQGEGNCTRPAGWGTSHAGAGRCKLHGGNSPSGRASGERALAAQNIRSQLGIPRDVDPASAILELVQEAAGNVEYLRSLVADPRNTEAMIDYQGKPHTNPVLAFYNEERDRLARASKLASDMKIDEARVRIAEAQGRALAEVVQAAVEACNPTPDERRAAIEAAGERMRMLGSSTPLAVAGG